MKKPIYIRKKNIIMGIFLFTMNKVSAKERLEEKN